MITARSLTKRYDEQAVLDRIDFDIPSGQRVALLGLNGAGKTTLLHCLLGLCRFEGSLTLDGLAAGAGAEGRQVRARIGYVPQQPPRYDMRLAEFVSFLCNLRGITIDGMEGVLDTLGLPLPALGHRRLGELSGGMIQKALLAAAMGSGASVLLLDEPTASLDASARRDFLRVLEATPPDTTLVFASHRLDDIEALAERVVLLHRGRFAFDGEVDELWRRSGVARPLRAAGAPKDPRLETVLERLVRATTSGDDASRKLRLVAEDT